MVSSPAQANMNTAKARGPSNPENQGAIRWRRGIFRIDTTWGEIIPKVL